MASKATMTSVAASGTSGSLIGANPKRNGLIIHNNGTGILFILLGGGTATATTACSLQIATLASVDLGNFHGAVSGIWTSANGSAQITELE